MPKHLVSSVFLSLMAFSPNPIGASAASGDLQLTGVEIAARSSFELTQTVTTSSGPFTGCVSCASATSYNPNALLQPITVTATLCLLGLAAVGSRYYCLRSCLRPRARQKFAGMSRFEQTLPAASAMQPDLGWRSNA